MNLPPLLDVLFGKNGGYVLYKGYPPHRGDDAAAMVELATFLPTTVHFLPVPPAIDTVTDLRRFLRVILLHPELDFIQPVPDMGQDPAKKSIGEELLKSVSEESNEVREAAKDRILPILHQALKLANINHDATVVLKTLETHQPVLLDLFLWIVARNLRREMAAGNDLLFTSRNEIHIPGDKPILIIGRPEFFRGYAKELVDDADAPGRERTTPLRRLLDSAGYPNRFCFIGETADSAGNRSGFRDRKTFRQYRQTEYDRDDFDRDDVGFLFMGRTSQGQLVMVATASSSLGTFAAVKLLTQDRPEFARAITRLQNPSMPQCLDIGFRCWFDQMADTRPFPLTTAAQHLDIELFNSDDLVGYTWASSAYNRIRELLDIWQDLDKALVKKTTVGDTRTEPNITWRLVQCQSCPGPAQRGGRIATVEMHARIAYQVAEKETLWPSGKLVGVFKKIDDDLQQDIADWSKKLRAWVHDGDWSKICDRMSEDRTYRTFLPILVLGETGSGKQWVAEYIARGWRGAVLASDLPGFPNAGQGFLPHTAAEMLPTRLQAWLYGHPGAADERQVPSSILTCSPVTCPVTLLDAALFGNGAKIANDVSAHPGVFLLAGSGVLFLDEFFELKQGSQSRVLVALQNGRVQPVREGREYVYACRVVVATNRARTEAELRRMARRGKARKDVVARFGHRYELPPLRERPLEVVPILYLLLRDERLCTDQSLYVRFSRNAFEALMMNAFPENVRDLRRLVDNLPKPLLESFTSPSQGLSLEELQQSSILLQHLACLEGMDTGSHESGANDFYEFILIDPEEIRDPGKVGRLTSHPNQLDRPSREVPNELARILHAHQQPLQRIQGRIQEMLRETASNMLTLDQWSQLSKEPEISDSLKALCGSLIELHHDLKKGLGEKRLLTWLIQCSSELKNAMPLHGVDLVAEGVSSEEALEKWDDAIQSCLVPKERKRSLLQKMVMLSVLRGEPTRVRD